MARKTMLIIGLGQIGVSIGLALSEHKDQYERIGFTRQQKMANHARKIGAIDKTTSNLVNAAKDADVVILALPIDEVKETLETIVGDLKEEVLVLDTSLAQEASFEWVEKIFPKDRYYLGFTPVLGPRDLHSPVGGIKEASEKLFEDGLFVITTKLKTNSESIDLASELAYLLLAQPLFAEVGETDSYYSALHLLPQLIAAGLTNITFENSGWSEGKKIAGRPYALLTNLLENTDPIESISLAARLNKEHVLRHLNNLIEELQFMRDDLEKDGGEFDTRLEKASQGRKSWWEERKEANWGPEGRNPNANGAGRIELLG